MGIRDPAIGAITHCLPGCLLVGSCDQESEPGLNQATTKWDAGVPGCTSARCPAPRKEKGRMVRKW